MCLLILINFIKAINKFNNILITTVITHENNSSLYRFLLEKKKKLK